jgi:hypothetical protein
MFCQLQAEQAHETATQYCHAIALAHLESIGGMDTARDWFTKCIDRIDTGRQFNRIFRPGNSVVSVGMAREGGYWFADLETFHSTPYAGDYAATFMAQSPGCRRKLLAILVYKEVAAAYAAAD